METPGRRHHPGGSASAAGPLQWRAGEACRGAGQGLGQTPRPWVKDCCGLGAGQGPTVRNEAEHQVKSVFMQTYSTGTTRLPVLFLCVMLKLSFMLTVPSMLVQIIRLPPEL